MFLKLFFIFAFLFFLFPQKISAATFTFSGQPSSILDNQSFSVNVSLSVNGSSGNIYYIRGAFANQSTPTSYFGYTKNDQGIWYNGKPTIDKTKFYKITMTNNQWQGKIELKPDTSDSGYKGGGNYNFKIGRYTSTGNTISWCNDDSTPCSISTISITSSSTPTPTPTSVEQISSSPLSESFTPNPTSISINLFDNLKASTSSKSVLPVSTKASSLNPTPSSKETKILADKEINPSKILIGVGFIIIVLSSGIFIKSLKK